MSVSMVSPGPSGEGESARGLCGSPARESEAGVRDSHVQHRRVEGQCGLSGAVGQETGEVTQSTSFKYVFF